MTLAGDVTRSDVSLSTAKAALVLPNLTALVLVKYFPLIVTVVPPAADHAAAAVRQ